MSETGSKCCAVNTHTGHVENLFLMQYMTMDGWLSHPPTIIIDDAFLLSTGPVYILSRGSWRVLVFIIFKKKIDPTTIIIIKHSLGLSHLLYDLPCLDRDCITYIILCNRDWNPA